MEEKNPGKKAEYDVDSLIPLEIRYSFHTALKRGIYKELHRRKMLSDGQLSILLKTK